MNDEHLYSAAAALAAVLNARGDGRSWTVRVLPPEIEEEEAA